MSADTIAAIATAPGRAGVAVVRISGPDAFEVAKSLCGRIPAPGRFLHASVRGADGATVDDAVVLAFRAPRSYTGEDTVEIQGHGGAIAPRRVLEACFAAGARLARRGEFTERAFLNGRLDYDQAESVLELIEAKTDTAADAALEGLAGRKKREYRRLYEETMALSAELEHSLDVSEEELPADFANAIHTRIGTLVASVDAALDRLRRGRILRDGALVVLAGPPNAGKSSLMNALLGESRAIVSETPGTTRDTIEEWLDLDGWPVRLVDTAGLRETRDAIEAEGVRRAQSLVAAADVIVDFTAASTSPKAIPILAKCDLGGASAGDAIPVSARTGEGLDRLRDAIAGRVAALEPKSADRGVDALLAARRILAAAEAEVDPVLVANAVRSAAGEIGALIGAVYSEDLLDRLFSRFCVGK